MKGVKPERHDLIAPDGLAHIARAYGLFALSAVHPYRADGAEHDERVNDLYNRIMGEVVTFWAAPQAAKRPTPRQEIDGLARAAVWAITLLTNFERPDIVGEAWNAEPTDECRYDLIPPQALQIMAIHYGAGAHKYSDNNWRAGYEWSKSYAALMRHLMLWRSGEELDEETGTPHLAAVTWHLITLMTRVAEFPQFDDRWKPAPARQDSAF